jgi:EAL domain-containing protein (putative c-di-GMP-specific phosphodiesterase class I)/GGDEF domain-containing protein
MIKIISPPSSLKPSFIIKIMNKSKNYSSNQISFVVVIIILLGVAISSFVFLKGGEVSDKTRSLLVEDIPNYELLTRFESQLIEEERVLYEFYATEDPTLISINLKNSRINITSILADISINYTNSIDFELINKKINNIRKIETQFIENIMLVNTDWQLARKQLLDITTARRQGQPALERLLLRNKSKVETSQSNIFKSLFQVRNFVVLYSIFTIIITIVVGRVLKAYLLALSRSKRLSLFPERNPNPVISLSLSNQIVYVNPACEKILLELGKKSTDIMCLLPKNIEQYQIKASRGNEMLCFDYDVLDKSMHCEIHWLPDQQEWDLHLRDITEQKSAEEQLTYQAFHNPETSLPNRYALSNRTISLIKEDIKFSLGIIELHNLRKMYSLLGIETTIKIFKELAKSLEGIQSSSKGHHFELYHASEAQFVLLSKELINQDIVFNFLMDLTNKIESILFSNEHKVKLCMGFAFYPNHGQRYEELLSNARIALDHSINKNNHEPVVFTLDIGKKVKREEALLTEMQKALDHKEFILNFQPQLDLQTNKIIGAEVLIRWNCHGQWISPAEFIPLAESSGFIINLGSWILNESCLYAKKIVDAGYDDFVIAVNISPRQFSSDDFIGSVSKILHNTGLRPENLELEITEGVLVDNEEVTIKALSQFKNLGIKLAIDDFGTGYSSLSYLKKFAIDKLKVDQSFIKNILTDKADEAIVKTIIELGHNLGLTLIAEGVEEIEQLQLLQQLGCEEIQGYYYSRPLTFEDLSYFLKKA